MNNYYYNLNDLESRGANITFVMGSRGNGKSYSAKKKMINLFLKSGKEVAYVRRHVNELDGVMLNIFDDVIEKEYPNLNIQLEGNSKTGYYYTIDEKPFCHLFALKTMFKKKGVAYPNLDFIFFDEYVPEDMKYLKDEQQMILSMMSTIFRDRKSWRVHFASNSISYVNPIFELFGIQPRGGQEFYTRSERDKDGNKRVLFALQITGITDYEQNMLNSDLGLISKIANIDKYMYSNEVLKDNNEHILKTKPKGYNNFIAVFNVGNKYFGCWCSHDYKDVYIDEKYNMNDSKQTRAYIYSEDKKENFIDIKYLRGERTYKTLKKWYLEGRIMFKNQNIKMAFISDIAPYL